MMTETTTASPTHVYALPGDAFFPESVGVDPRTGDAYVGSLADGTLVRLPADGGEAHTWSVAGEHGRDSVAGVKVDAAGRLWAAGGYDGTLWVYESSGREPIARLDVGARPSCVNDIAFGPDGAAYVTDSFIPTLFRVSGEPLRLEPWVDFLEQGVPWPEGLNLNGIVLTRDGRHLLTCQTNLGRFWRIALDNAGVEEVLLDEGPLEHCDGMALAGSRLYVAVNARGLVALAELSDDGGSLQLRKVITSDAFAFPTAVAVHGSRLLVVNAQLDKMGGAPDLPFTVAVLPAG
jgi:superoxide dismutase, Cu-Zn family